MPKTEIDKITAQLNPLLKGRLLETIRMDRKIYIKNYSELEKCIEELTGNEQHQRELRFMCK